MPEITTLPQAEARVGEIVKFIGTPRTKRESRVLSLASGIMADIPDAPVPTPPPVVQPPVVVPPAGQLQDVGPIRIDDGESHVIENKRIVNTANDSINSGYALMVLAANVVTIRNCEFYGFNYGAWIEHTNEVRFEDCKFFGGTGGDNYAIRSYATKHRSKNCLFDNSVNANRKSCARFVGCLDGESDGDTFKGGRINSGGGAASFWEGEGPSNIVFKNGFMSVDSLECHENSKTVLDNIDALGTGKVFVDDGATLIVRNGCRDIPWIQRKSINGTTVTITP